MADPEYRLYYWPEIQGRGEFVRLVLEDAAASYLDVARLPDDEGEGMRALMAFLARGDDPNFGEYALVVRKALRFIIGSQDKNTGFLPTSMYNHGFAMLALAEAYGAVDDDLLWDRLKDQGVDEFYKLWRDCGLWDGELHPRRSLFLWKHWLRRRRVGP